MCCGIAAVVTLLAFLGLAVVMSVVFFAEVNHRVRVHIARRCPVVEAGATLEDKFSQALSRVGAKPKAATHTTFAEPDSGGAVAADVVGTPMANVPACDAA